MANNTYIQILISILTKKNNLLEEIIRITLLQEESISQSIPDLNQFEKAISDKELLIENMNQIDDGFEKVYDHVRDELNNNKMQFKEDIILLQELIKEITDKSVKLQTLENSNKFKIESLFLSKKKEIKNFKLSNNTVLNYYKNMPNQHQGQSYFLDKKK